MPLLTSLPAPDERGRAIVRVEKIIENSKMESRRLAMGQVLKMASGLTFIFEESGQR